jgi:polyisoprenoid-binding protein YceI
MKTKKTRITWMLLSVIAFIAISAIILITSSCKKEGTVTPQGLNLSTGSDIIDIGDSTAANPVHPNFILDQVHSNVGWQTLFQFNNALLTGRFNMFNTSIHFDQKNPQNTAISSWVLLSTFNTGEPGRDNPGGCGQTNMGVQYNVNYADTAGGNPPIYTVIPSSDTAWFKCPAGSCQGFGTGYIANGTLNFRNVTHPVSLYFNYTGMHNVVAGGDTTKWVGFTGQFTMQAGTWYGVSLSDNINDSVTVLVNYNAKN